MGKLGQVCVLLSFLGLGACHQQPTVQDILTDRKAQFWDCYSPRLHHFYYTNRFYANGDCFRYVFNRDSTIDLYVGSDVLLPHQWKLAADTLTVDGIPYHVVRFAMDSIFLKHRINPDTFILIRARPRPIKAR